eukprot:jgi/Tetstr1/431526/TSEL_002178.t1
MNAEVPTFFQWDDHEVVNNWSAFEGPHCRRPATPRRTSRCLPPRAGRAFHEMTPIRYQPAEPGRVYRKIAYGPLLDVFFLDLRSYRADRMVIACDMPIGVIVWDDWKAQAGAEAVANGDDGAPKGRELEFADLLRPDRAQIQDFKPFWEFVSGPLHAGTFGPNALDKTFGPEVKYVKAPDESQGANLPPSMGLQFFGLVDIDGASEQMTVRLMDVADQELYSVTLDPVRKG